MKNIPEIGGSKQKNIANQYALTRPKKKLK